MASNAESSARDDKIQDEPNLHSIISPVAQSGQDITSENVDKMIPSETREPGVIECTDKMDPKTEKSTPVAEVPASQKLEEHKPQEECVDKPLGTDKLETAVVKSESAELCLVAESALAEMDTNVETHSTVKESADIGVLDKCDPNQLVSSSPSQKEGCPPTFPETLEKSEDGHPQPETSTPEIDSKDEAISEPPSHDALVTLDEVSEGEEDYLDESNEDQHSKAGEVPEALLTVDEVGDDETGGEEYQLDKELQGLVTLDEIVDDEEEFDSFNPEVSSFWLTTKPLKLCLKTSLRLLWFGLVHYCVFTWPLVCPFRLL